MKAWLSRAQRARSAPLLRIGYAATTLSVATIIATAVLWAQRTDGSDAAQAFAAMDRTHPGRGRDVYRDAEQDHPTAYALYASAAVDLGDIAAARSAARWLVRNTGNGGWSLGFAWDAFSDGSINPPETVYGITTALCVRALFDVYDATGDQDFADAALAALDRYASRFTRTGAGGFFWYSDQSADAIQVTNVSAMLAAQYARSAKIFGREDHSALAMAAVRQLLGERKEGGFWAYGATRPDPNDAGHAAYVVIGLGDFARYSDQAIDLSAEVAHLKSFIRPSLVVETVGGNARARAGGVAQIAHALADAGYVDGAVKVTKYLRAYQSAAGRYCYRPSEACHLPRLQAQVLNGLARVERRAAEPRKWERLTEKAGFSPRDSARGFEFDGQLWLSNGYYHGHVALRDLWQSADGVNWRVVNESTPYDAYSGMTAFRGYIWAANHSVWRSRDGAAWEQALALAPFSDVRGRTAQARLLTFKGSLWFLGFGDVWSSRDGVNWDRMPDPPYGERGGYQAVVWRDRIWVLGGWKPVQTTPPERGYPERTSLNDIWASSDGRAWEKATSAAAWSPRMWHAAVPHGGSLYVIGGYSGSNHANLSDVWITYDGRNWRKVETGDGVSPRHFPTVFSRADDILLIAGNAWPVTNDVWRLSAIGR